MIKITKYKTRDVKIIKTPDDNNGYPPIFWKYDVVNLKDNKILETFYCNS